MNCSGQGCVKKLLVDTVAYVFIDIPFLDSRSPYFLKKWLRVAQGKNTQNDA